jgi:hypothetical protein|tara:strand:+ start:19 stop:570 length:552 start_codon:yes stop_codon:yes gene_type:complete
MNKDKAFVYIWYVSATKKSYIGSSIGNPHYTHSSTDKEFCSYVPNSSSPAVKTRDFLANIPKGITYTIIEYGAYDEILMLERKLQTEAKVDTNPDYYNKVICDGKYYGFPSGENHPLWKGGVTLDRKSYAQLPKQKVYQKAYNKAYQQTPEGKAANKKAGDKRRAKLKAETGFARGYSKAKGS